MTEGKAFTHLWRYALPILLGSWLQLAYNAVDSIIAGRFIGRNALAAEGIAGPVMNLVILFINGLCIGSGVLMSEAFGKSDYERLRNTHSTLIISGMISSLVLSLLAFIFSPSILRLMRCPDEIFSITNIYLRIIFLGTPFTFLYNALASALKSVGDSKTPLMFLTLSSVLNGVLDLVFLGLFGFGITCSALTTVIAEAVSAALAFLHMVRKEKVICPGKENMRIDTSLLASILSYAAPTALQQAIQPIGKVLIQGEVNSLGVSTIASYNAVTRIDDFACIPEQGIATAIATFTAQNRGAGKTERIREGFRKGITLELSYGVLVCLVTFILRRVLVALFVSGESAGDVVSCGVEYLTCMAFFYILPSLTNGFQGFYRGMGKMKTTVLGTFIQTSVRTLCTYLLAPAAGIKGIAFSCAFGWTLMLFFEIPYYFITVRRNRLLSFIS